MLRIRCPHCAIAVRASDRAIGKTFTCPSCRGKANIESAESIVPILESLLPAEVAWPAEIEWPDVSKTASESDKASQETDEMGEALPIDIEPGITGMPEPVLRWQAVPVKESAKAPTAPEPSQATQNLPCDLAKFDSSVNKASARLRRRSKSIVVFSFRNRVSSPGGHRVSEAELTRAEQNLLATEETWRKYGFRQIPDQEISQARDKLRVAQAELSADLPQFIDWLSLKCSFLRFLDFVSAHGFANDLSRVELEIAERNKRAAMKSRQIEPLKINLATLEAVRNAQTAYWHARQRNEELQELVKSAKYRLLHCGWRELRGVDFERFLASVFEFRGYAVEFTKASGDNGVDLVVTANGIRIAIQSKGYGGSSVGISAVQEVYTGRALYNCDRSIVVTNSCFTRSARQAAESLQCMLIDGDQIPDLIEGRII